MIYSNSIEISSCTFLERKEYADLYIYLVYIKGGNANIIQNNKFFFEKGIQTSGVFEHEGLVEGKIENYICDDFYSFNK